MNEKKKENEIAEVIAENKIVSAIRHLSIRKKILYSLVLVAFVSVISITLYFHSFFQIKIHDTAKQNILAQRVAASQKVERYFKHLTNVCVTFSENQTCENALRDLTYAFQENSNQVAEKSGDRMEAISTGLRDYYTTRFLPELNALLDKESSMDKVFVEDNNVQYLQYYYIFKNEYKGEEKDLLIDANDGGEYTNAHIKYHSQLKNIKDKFNLYDLYLVDMQGNIVYSERKEIDFGINLLHGQYKTTEFARSYKFARESRDDDFFKITDLENYTPSLLTPSMFISSPVFSGDNKLGVVIFQLSGENLNELTTVNQEWEEEGYGKTGEAYILGNDFKMRTESRFLIENKADFLKTQVKADCDKVVLNKIERRNTTVLLQDEKSDIAFEALRGVSGVDFGKDYRSKKVLSSYAPLNIPGLDWAIVVNKEKGEVNSALAKLRLTVVFFLLIVLTVIYLVSQKLSKKLANRLVNLQNSLTLLAQGNEVREIEDNIQDEIGVTVKSFNKVLNRLELASNYAVNIGNNEYDVDFEVLGAEDKLGNALVKMRESIKEAKEEEEKRKVEDEKRNWTNHGIANFSAILRENNDDIVALSYQIISNLVEYLEANQGGIYMFDDEEDEKVLNLTAAYAYSKRKFINKQYKIGEGLVGTCALERKRIYLKEIPENYSEIASGLGSAQPKTLLLIPLKLDEEFLGVLEIASFYELEDYKSDFVERVAEIIASTLSTVKMNTKNARLLKESNNREQEMTQQEEEMRQNMEELQATQEEVERLSEESVSFVTGIDNLFLRADFSEEGTLIYANQPFLNELGYKSDDVKNVHISNFVSGSFKEDINAKWDAIAAGKLKVNEDLKLLTQSHDEIWYNLDLIALRNRSGEILKVLMIGQNIEEKAKLEEETKKQAKKLAQQAEAEEQNCKELEKVNSMLKENEKKLAQVVAKSKDEIDNLQAELEMMNIMLKKKDNEIKKLKEQ